jgi:hypothetical protein
MSTHMNASAAFAAPASIAPIVEVSAFRLNALRAGYLLLVVGLGSQIWPAMIHHAKPWDLMHGVASSMLAAMSALAVLGLRYPLRMLPLLFFELLWKAIWLIAIALPLWSAGQMDAATAETVRECLVVIVFPIVIPWRYVLENYLKKPGDRWREPHPHGTHPHAAVAHARGGSGAKETSPATLNIC